MQGFVGVDEGLEVASLLDREPVKFLEVGGDVGLPGEVKDESGCGVLYCLEFPEEAGIDAGVECVAIVEAAGDECLSDCFPCVGGEPFEDLSEHTEGEEAC